MTCNKTRYGDVKGRIKLASSTEVSPTRHLKNGVLLKTNWQGPRAFATTAN